MTNYIAPIYNIPEDLATPLFDAIISATMSRERPDVDRFDVQHLCRHIPGGDHHPTLAFPCDLHDDLRHATCDEIADHFNAEAIERILIDDVRTSQRAHDDDDDTHHHLADDIIGDIRSGRVPLLTPATRENPPILTKSDTFGSPDTPLRIDGVTVAIHPVAVRMLELFQDLYNDGTLDPDAVEDVAMKWYLEGVESVLGYKWDTSPHLREALTEVEESSGTIHDHPYEDGVNNAHKVCVQGARHGVSLITLQHYSPCLPGVLAAMRGYRDLTGETPDRHTVIPFAVIRRSVEDCDWNWLMDHMGHIGDVLEEVDDWPHPLKA